MLENFIYSCTRIDDIRGQAHRYGRIGAVIGYVWLSDAARQRGPSMCPGRWHRADRAGGLLGDSVKNSHGAVESWHKARSNQTV